jgi:hypothetical protein
MQQGEGFINCFGFDAKGLGAGYFSLLVFLICCKNSNEYFSRPIPSINIYNVMLLKRMYSTEPCLERT